MYCVAENPPNYKQTHHGKENTVSAQLVKPALDPNLSYRMCLFLRSTTSSLVYCTVSKPLRELKMLRGDILSRAVL